MQKATTSRHWKQVIKSRKQQTGSLNESRYSNRSSMSSGYNKFQFNRPEDTSKRNSIFQFTARNKDNPHEVSILTKREHRRSSRAKKAGSQQQLPELEYMLRRMPTFGQIQHKNTTKSLLKEFRSIIESFRSTIEYFNQQMKEIRWDWQKAMTTLTIQQISPDSTVVLDLKRKLDEKQKEIERVSRESSFFDKNHMSEVSGIKADPYQTLIQSPFRNLGISKVAPAPDPSLSRTNTLQSLLAETTKKNGLHSPSQNNLPPIQIVSLLDRVHSMRQLLQTP